MTTNSECDNLDAFQAGELHADLAEQFAAHLPGCAECRASVDEQQWIDALLRSPLAANLESPSAEFTSSIKSTLAQSHQRAGLFACVFAAAAALAIAAGWTVWWISRDASDVAEGADNQILKPPQLVQVHDDAGVSPHANEAPPKPSPRAVVVGNADTLIIPVASPHPDVTIVRVYPVYQPQFAASENSLPATSGGQFSWRDDFNGGSP
jgi:hypothetical protein